MKRYKAVLPSGEIYTYFVTKKEIEDWIQGQIQVRGLDWRAGYLIRFRDKFQVDIVKLNNERIKT